MYLRNNTFLNVTELQQAGTGFSYYNKAHPEEPLQWVEKSDVSLIVFNSGEVKAFHMGDSCILPFNHPTHDLILLSDGDLLPVDNTIISNGQISADLIGKTDMTAKSYSLNRVVALFDRTKKIQAFAKYEEIARQLIISQLGDERSQTDIGTIINQEDELLHIDKEAFKNRALEQTKKLTQYIGLISDRNTPSSTADKAISEALTLFLNNSCIVEVSNINKPNAVPQSKTIVKYLNDVKRYFYDKVIIEWVDIYYVGEIRKGTDGNYYGTVSFAQKFQGFKDGLLVYKDLTYKTVEVVFKTYDKYKFGLQEEQWDVLLSNIRVEQTSQF